VSEAAFLLNGRHIRVVNPEPHKTLLDFVREQGLTGSKEGCAEGECGACAVAVVEPRAEEQTAEYRVINSCLMLLPMVAGREIYTVESLGSPAAMSDAQRVMVEDGGSQCGYCTPGFVVSLFAEHHRPDRTGACDTAALSGNLCRCTGYRPIRDAARSLGPAPEGPFLQRLSQPAPVLQSFSCDGFSRPSSVEEIVKLLRTDKGAKLIAGGTDLCVESNLRGSRWPHLVSVEAIDELRAFSNTSSRITIGAALSLNEIGGRWADAPDVFREWLSLFASPLIRNRATLGGNLATASPIGDGAPLLLALDAEVELAGPNGRRTVPLSSFFQSYRKTAMLAGELIVSIVIPKPLPASLRFFKIAKRRLDDISTVAMAIAMDVDERSAVRRSRFALGGVAATPVLLKDAEDAVIDRPWDDAAVERVQRAFDRTLKPLSDHRGSKEYRLEVSKSLIEKHRWEQRA